MEAHLTRSTWNNSNSCCTSTIFVSSSLGFWICPLPPPYGIDQSDERKKKKMPRIFGLPTERFRNRFSLFPLYAHLIEIRSAHSKFLRCPHSPKVGTIYRDVPGAIARNNARQLSLAEFGLFTAACSGVQQPLKSRRTLLIRGNASL